MFAGIHGSPPTTLVLTERSNPLTSSSYLLLFSDGTRQASIHIASRLSTPSAWWFRHFSDSAWLTGQLRPYSADIDQLIRQALEIQSSALTEVGPEQVEVIRLEMTVLENLKRIHTYLKRIAQEIVPQEIRGWIVQAGLASEKWVTLIGVEKGFTRHRNGSLMSNENDKSWELLKLFSIPNPSYWASALGR